ncbi:putative methionyl-tRNA synthetase [Hordeum vulgare]|nr:putative methionyl-tRNA synthetase [Hordeum vulgare]
MEGPLGRCVTGQPLVADVILGRSSATDFSHDPRTPSHAFNTGLNTQYSYSPSVYSSTASPALSLHRGVLPFVPTSSLQFNYVDVDMDEIIMNGSVASASHPEFGGQDETMDTNGDIDDELDDAEEEEEGEEEPVEVEPEVVPKKKEGKRKRAAYAKLAEPCVKWTSKEDKCLAEAWKTVSIDPVTGANQNTDTYRGRIKTAFVEHKLVYPEFANIHVDRAREGHVEPLVDDPDGLQQVAWHRRGGHCSPEKRRQCRGSGMDKVRRL